MLSCGFEAGGGLWFGQFKLLNEQRAAFDVVLRAVLHAKQADSKQSISADGAIANPGDLIYYEWNGVESDQHVHLTMITGYRGRVALVTQQSGDGLYAENTQWNWSYISNESLIKKYGSQARAYLLHWQ